MIAVPIVLAVVGNYAGAALGAYIGLSGAMLSAAATIGGMIGGIAGSLIAMGRQDSTMAGSQEYPLQGAKVGSPICRVIGTVRKAGNIVYTSDLKTRTNVDKKRSFGFIVAKNTTYWYSRSVLVALCEGPARILAIWKDNERISLAEATIFTGDGNIGMESIIGVPYSKYKNVCCAYFENLELGNASRVPNFVFEVTSVNTGSYIYTIHYTGGIFTIERRTDNLDGTFTTTASLVGTGNTKAIFQDGTKAIYVQEGTDLMKFYENLTPVTTWQTAGTLPIGAPFTLVAVNKVDDQVYYVSGSTLYCLDKDGIQLWSTALSDFTSVNCQGCFDLNNDLFMDTGISPSPRLLIQHFDHTTGTYIRGHVYTNYADNYVISMAYNAYSDNLVVAYYRQNVPTTKYRLWCGHYNSEQLLWEKWISFIGGGSIKCVHCDPAGYIYVGSTNDCVARWLYPLPVPITYCSIQRFTNGGDQSYYLDTGDTVTGIGNNTKYELAVGREGSGISTFGIYSDYVKLLRSGTISGTLPIICDDKITEPSNVNAAEVAYTILTDPALGNMDPALIDSTTYLATKAYCTTHNLNISINMQNQSSVMDWLDAVNGHFMGYTMPREGRIYVGLYKDETLTFQISRDDIIDLVKVKDRDRSETANHVTVGFTDRNNNYALSTVVANDWVDQEITGQVRSKAVTLTGIMDSTYAQMMCDRILTEMMFRYTVYSVVTSYKKSLLSPGMVGTINDGKRILGEKVRIIFKQTSENGESVGLTMITEGSHLYLQPATGVAINNTPEQAAPDLQTPIVTVIESTTDASLIVCLAPRGDTNGWTLLMSRDDDSFETLYDSIPCDSTFNRNSSGLTVTTMPAYPVLMYCPDDYVDVDIYSGQTIDSASEADFFASLSTIKIDDEIIGFKTAIDISDPSYQNRWRLSCLIRGMNNTVPVVHAVEATFATLIENARIYYREEDVSKPIYLVAVSFYGKFVQLFEECGTTPYLVQGLYKRPAPVSLVRIDDPDDEGIMEYAGATFTLEWQLGNKSAGFNIGCFNCDGTVWEWTDAREIAGTLPTWNDGIIWGSSPVESEITGIVLQFFDDSDVFLDERTVSSAAVSETITNATDLAGGIVNYVNVLPVSKYRSYYSNKIKVDKI